MNEYGNPSKIQSFTDLDAWKEGHKLVLEVYDVTTQFPREEQFGLSNQLRRAAVSITSNIAEGFSRNSYKEKVQFYTTALGSITEIQNQLLIAKDVGYLTADVYSRISDQAIRVHKITNGLIKHSRTIIHNS